MPTIAEIVHVKSAMIRMNWDDRGSQMDLQFRASARKAAAACEKRLRATCAGVGDTRGGSRASIPLWAPRHRSQVALKTRSLKFDAFQAIQSKANQEALRKKSKSAT